jgi:hypothetical protein
MKPIDSINLEIAQLEELRVSLPGLDSDRWFALVLCRELLTSGGVPNLRALVGSAVRGIQPQVSRAAGIRRATISDFVNGKYSMSADNVERVLRASLAVRSGLKT